MTIERERIKIIVTSDTNVQRKETVQSQSSLTLYSLNVFYLKSEAINTLPSGVSLSEFGSCETATCVQS